MPPPFLLWKIYPTPPPLFSLVFNIALTCFVIKAWRFLLLFVSLIWIMSFLKSISCQVNENTSPLRMPVSKLKRAISWTCGLLLANSFNRELASSGWRKRILRLSGTSKSLRLLRANLPHAIALLNICRTSTKHCLIVAGASSFFCRVRLSFSRSSGEIFLMGLFPKTGLMCLL